jgi:hydrogenase maturation protein HypF
LREQYNINAVTLSGGVWQNVTLLRKACQLLIDDRFEVYLHRQVPPNDGGLALGQASVAAHRLKNDT